jgi:hypothetical protein
MKWRVEFYNERRRIPAPYDVGPSSPRYTDDFGSGRPHGLAFILDPRGTSLLDADRAR